MCVCERYQGKEGPLQWLEDNEHEATAVLETPSPLENCIVQLVTSEVHYQNTNTLKVVPLHLYCWYNKSLSNERN